jgi:AraC-like DNA-binding protein
MMKFFRALILIYSSIFSSWFLSAQENSEHIKDSLRGVIENGESIEKLKAYQQLTNRYFPESFGNPAKLDTLVTLYQEMKAESEKNGDLRYAGIALQNTLGAYENNKMYDKIKELIPGYLNFLSTNNLWDYYYGTSNLILKIYREQGEYDKALEEANKIYEEAKEKGHQLGVAAMLSAISGIYGSISRLEEEEKYMRESIEIYKEINNWKLLPTCYFHLCQCLVKQQSYDEAKELLSEYEYAITRSEDFLESRNVIGWENFWVSSANVYLKAGDYEKADFYCKKLEESNPNAYRKNIAVMVIRGTLFEERKEYEKALQIMDLRIKADDRIYMAMPLQMQKARILTKMGRADDAYNLYMDVFEAKDSLRSVEYNTRLDELRTQYEVDKHIAEKTRHRNYFLFALGGCVLLLSLLVIWIMYSRRLHKKNVGLVRQILEQNALEKQRQAEKAELEQLRKALVEKSGVEQAAEDPLFEQLERYMNTEQPYTDVGLNRKMLADALHTNEQYMMNSIKTNTGLTVHDYITGFRLRHAKNLMLADKRHTAESVALDAGFGNRYSFHNAFRNHYGLTPGEFRKIISQQP